MMKFQFFALCALFVTASGAVVQDLDLNLEPLSRRAFPNDIKAEWELQSEPSPLCPTTITHTAWRNNDDGSFSAPHFAIMHDSVACYDGFGKEFTFYPSTMFEDTGAVSPVVPDALIRLLDTAKVNIYVKEALDAYGEDYFIGHEPEARYCKGSKFEAMTTSFLLRPWRGPVTIDGLDTPIVPMFKYLIMVPRYAGEACVYRADLELFQVPTPVVEPDSTPIVSLEPESSSEAAV